MYQIRAVLGLQTNKAPLQSTLQGLEAIPRHKGRSLLLRQYVLHFSLPPLTQNHGGAMPLPYYHRQSCGWPHLHKQMKAFVQDAKQRGQRHQPLCCVALMPSGILAIDPMQSSLLLKAARIACWPGTWPGEVTCPLDGGRILRVALSITSLHSKSRRAGVPTRHPTTWPAG